MPKLPDTSQVDEACLAYGAILPKAVWQMIARKASGT